MFALILAATHFYMFERLSSYLDLDAGQRFMTGLILGGLALLTLIAIPLSRLLPRRAASVLSWIVYPWMGISLLMFVIILATDIIWILSYFVPANDLPKPRYEMQYDFGIGALVLTALLSALSLWKGVGFVVVKPLSITLENLPRSFDGFRIVQITDLHVGPIINGKWLQKIVDRVNALKPDMIVITGDLIDGSVAELQKHVAPIAELKAKHGVYFITGNHEYYSGVEEWCAHVASLGIRVLRNEHVSITSDQGNESFDLAGVDDLASHHFPGQGADMAKALATHNPKNSLILLAHQPAAASEAATFGVDLQLSGHTHGGQIWPFTYLVYLQQPYTQGLYRYADTKLQVYVSPGTGFWGPPMRLGTTAEITDITLRSGAHKS
jgi:predicted MPP superfamily phosphohydrolase